MKRPKSHRIDEEAQRIFKCALPSGWTPNEYTYDYGKDYIVETCVGDSMTGESFHVQLKGQSKVTMRSKKGLVQFSLERKYAAYYLDKITDLPVFLVLVDVSQGCGWWLFLQPYLSNDQSWRNQRSALIRIPLSNRIDDIPRFAVAIENAKRTMRGMHPTAIADVIQVAKEDVARLDPRFNVALALEGDKVRRIFTAKEEVGVHVTFHGTSEGELKAKMTDLIERGKPVSFKPGEISASGSRLFELWGRESVTLQAESRIKISINLLAIDGDGNEIGGIRDIPGELFGGRNEVSFTGEIDAPLFTVSGGPLSNLQLGDGGGFSFQLLIDKWNGRPISKLPWFDRITSLLSVLDRIQNLRLEFGIDGHIAFGCDLLSKGLYSENVAKYFRQIKKVRDICKYFKVDPIWTEQKFADTDMNRIDRLYSVFIEGRYERRAPEATVTYLVDSSYREQIREDVLAEMDDEVEWDYEVLGVGIKAKATQILTKLRCEIVGADGEGRLELSLKGTPETLVQYKPQVVKDQV